MIQTERLLLRAWRDQDLALFARINGDPEVLDPAYCGRGLATETAAAVLKEGFGLLGLRRERPHPDTGQPLPICVYATSR